MAQTEQLTEQEQKPEKIQQGNSVSKKNILEIRNRSIDFTLDDILALITGIETSFVTSKPRRLRAKKGDSAPENPELFFRALVGFNSSEDAQTAIEKLKTASDKLTVSLAQKKNKKSKKAGKSASPATAESGATKETEQESEPKAGKATKAKKEKPPYDPEVREKKRLERQAKLAHKLESGIPSKDTVFVRGFDRESTEDEIKELFAKYNPKDIIIPKQRSHRSVILRLESQNIPIRHKGIAFVKVSNETEQKQIIKELDGFEFKGKNLNVDVSIDSVEALKKADEKAAAAAIADSASTTQDFGVTSEASKEN